jgi:Centromere DNA-binding protein complex CBF3 subunit, domain 2
MGELADFQMQRLPESERPQSCAVLVFILFIGKTNRWNKKEYIGAIRNRDIYLCPLGVMAQYFFWCWYYSNKTPLSFTDQCSWYRKKLLVGSTNTTEQEISYGT